MQSNSKKQLILAHFLFNLFFSFTLKMVKDEEFKSRKAEIEEAHS